MPPTTIAACKTVVVLMVIGCVYSIPLVAVMPEPLALVAGVEGKVYVNVLLPVKVIAKLPS